MFDIWDVQGRALPYTLRPMQHDVSATDAPRAASGRPTDRQPPTARRAMAAYAELRTVDPTISRPVARDWMSRPVVTVTTATLLDEAWALFRARHFRNVPVVDESDPAGLRPPVGMLSDRDLLRHFADHGGTPAGELPVMRVDEVMRTDILSARPETTIHRIAHVMVHEGVGALPVVDPEEGLVGILTRSDILRLAVQLTAAEFPSL